MIDQSLARQIEALLERPALEFSALPGATSSYVYLVSSGRERWVLRRFRPERWALAPTELCAREAEVLEALAGTGLDAPELIAIVDDGVLMSYLPGQVLLPDPPRPWWIDALARRLAGIHRTPLTLPRRFVSWNDTAGQPPPSWWPDAALWRELQQATMRLPEKRPPEQADVLLHRDYHPVNVLWRNNRISGVVDWINACTGPAGVDVAHCRLNLALMYGPSAADAFLNAYRNDRPTYQHAPRWDIDDGLGALPDVVPYPPWAELGMTPLTVAEVRDRLLGFLRAALERLG